MFTVADAARQAGVTGRTLRYYEELGLIRSTFTGRPSTLQSVRRGRPGAHQNMQSLGFSLETIRKVLRAAPTSTIAATI